MLTPVMRRLATVFVIGSIGGAICDQIHVQSGTTVYTSPVLFDQPWYIALIFGAGVLAGFIVAQRFARELYPTPPSAATIAAHGAIFLAAYFASALLHPHRLIAAAVLWGAFIVRAFRFPRPRPLIIFALIAGAGGTLIEISLSAAGSFHYVGHDFLGVPLWLPALYFHAAPVGLALARRFPL